MDDVDVMTATSTKRHRRQRCRKVVVVTITAYTMLSRHRLDGDVDMMMTLGHRRRQ